MSQVTVTTTTISLVTALCYVFWSNAHHHKGYNGNHLWALQHRISMMWFCHYSWSQGTQWGFLLVSPLCCSSNNLSPACLLRHMSTLPWDLLRWVLSFWFEPPTKFIMLYIGSCCGALLSVYKFQCGCICAPMGAQPLGQLSMDHASTASKRVELPATHSAVPQPFYLYGEAYSSGSSGVTRSLHLSYMTGRGLLFQFLFFPVTQSTPNLWWALNLAILVWWLGIRLMNLLKPGWQAASFPNHTSSLVSQAMYQH